MRFDEEVSEFVVAAHTHGVRMLLVGGAAVNFHGYQRQSADMYFWIDASELNLERLLAALRSMGFELEHMPEKVARSE